MQATHVLLATGAEPVRLGIPGEEHLVTSEEFLALEELPRRIVFVGGGYIAAEFSQIAALAGAQVTVLQRGTRMLKAFDADLVEWLMERFRGLNIDVCTHSEVRRVERNGNSFRVLATSGSFDAYLVVHASGRAPDFTSLGLDAAGVETDDGKLKLNEFLQSTSNPAVYAAGDAAQSGPPLTPGSSHDAKIVAENILHGNRAGPDYD